MRIAIVHHWFVTQGGGERVAQVMASMFPDAYLFTLVMDPDQLPEGVGGRSLTCSFLQRIAGGPRMHRHLLPLYPLAVEQLDITSYDLVLTSDSGAMKGVISRPSAVHICYCHSPMRYLWDNYHAYQAAMPRIARFPFALAAHYLRNWATWPRNGSLTLLPIPIVSQPPSCITMAAKARSSIRPLTRTSESLTPCATTTTLPLDASSPTSVPIF